MPELVLSNTTTFFSGKIEKVFKLARELGFKYLEIIPYRWTRPEQILKLQEKYQVKVAGIHMPFFRSSDLFAPAWFFYLGTPASSPGLKIAERLTDPYILFHTDAAKKLGPRLEGLKQKFHVVLENIPGEKAHNPISVFDPGHFGLGVPREINPEIIHISYNHGPFLHVLPNKKEEENLKEMLKIYRPKYIVLETNPWVSAKKGKLILEKILNPPF